MALYCIGAEQYSDHWLYDNTEAVFSVIIPPYTNDVISVCFLAVFRRIVCLVFGGLMEITASRLGEMLLGVND